MATEEEKNEATIVTEEISSNGEMTPATAAAEAATTAAAPLSSTGVALTAENRLGDNQYFFEDQVFCVNKNGRVKFGLVIETCDSYSDDEDNDEDQKLNRGEVRVAWYPSPREHIRTEISIGLADRTLMPGDVVRRMTAGCNPQRGYVRDIKITADVRVLKSPYVIKNVAAERLRPLSVWQRDCTVCLDSWVGSAKDVDERAILMGSNGVRFEIKSADFYHFKEASTLRRPSVFLPLIFFPGNVVYGRLPSIDKAKILTPDIPLLLNRKGSMLRAKFLVESVRTEGVIVQWQCKALSKANTSVRELEPPKPYVNAEQLTRVKRLNVFESCVLQMADRSFLTYEPPKDQIVTKAKWEKELAQRFRELFRQQHLHACYTEQQNKLLKKDQKSTTKAPTIKTQNESAERDSDWQTTTTASDTSDQSSGDDASENENDDDEADEFIERSDIESVTTANGDVDDECIMAMMSNENQANASQKTADAIGADGGSGGVVVTPSNKKVSTMKILAKKSTYGARYKHQHHARQQASTNKWLHKNAIYVPMNMSSVREGKELITETLLVYSTVSVVWQDGTIEDNIPSTQLYPIHHLDNHEFFPGDFTMLSVEDPKVTFRDYGVIQTVDHHGRTARVKWFTTYAPEDDEGVPTYKGENEVSVYDLKDHPDFTYRPGGMVIRVSNFIGEDAGCTAGQVLDNCIDGRVKVSWDDGHISCCWPQDLYDVGHHEQHDYAGDSDSWETESENSNPGGYDEYDNEHDAPIKRTAKDIIFYIMRAICNLGKFEALLKENPQLRERSVMRKLLHIYKKCRYLDRLLQTSFFHEDHFLGLIKRVDQEQNANDVVVDGNAAIEEQNEKSEKSSSAIVNDNPIVALQESPKQANRTAEPTPSTVNSSAMELALNKNEKVLLNLNFHLPHTSLSIVGGVGVSVVSPKGSNNPNSGNAASTPNRHCRNSIYNGHIVHVRYTPESPLSNVLAQPSQVKTVNENGQAKQSGDTNDNSNILDNSDLTLQEAAGAVALLATALLSIEQAYQVTTRVRAAHEVLPASVPPLDDSGTFSRSNSDIVGASTNGNGTTNAEENEHENPIEEVIKNLLANVDKNLSGSTEVSGHQKSTAEVPTTAATNKSTHETPDTSEDTNELSSATLICCLSFSKGLREQIQKCREFIETQYKVDLSSSIKSPTHEHSFLFDDEHDDETDHVGDEKNNDKMKTALPSPLLFDDLYIENDNTSVNKKNSKTELEKLLLADDDAVDVVDAASNSDIKQIAAASNDVPTISTTGASKTSAPAPAPIEPWIVPEECFKILPNAPSSHKFISNSCDPSQPQQYFRAVQREHRLLKTSLPKGIWLRFYEDRIDLLSVMMEGPKKTPYENGFYFFDMQLGRDYPKRPPVCHYISYCVDRLNPNLYEEGKVCVSLLGTWSGRDVEVWGTNSTLLQVLVSIQGLILVPEPYFNEAGYEKQKGSLQGLENSRMYNEMVVIKVVQATLKMLLSPPIIFKDEILEYYKQNGLSMYDRIRGWMELSKNYDKKNLPEKNHGVGNVEKALNVEFAEPDFPLLPASRGFCLTLASLLKNLEEKMLALANAAADPLIDADEFVENERATSTPKKASSESIGAEKQINNTEALLLAATKETSEKLNQSS